MRTLSNRTGAIRQGKAFNGDCGASKYSRSRIAPIEPVLSCTDPPEPMFMTPASTSAVGSSIGVGFASATVLKAMSNAAGIKGFIGLPSLLNASGNDRPVPRFQNVQYRIHEIVPQSGGCHLMSLISPRYLVWFVSPRYHRPVPSQMEDSMCWEIDYKFFAELEKARETRTKQEQRAGVIDSLLNDANKQSDKANVEGTTVKEVAPAK